ncbi:MAG: beta-galactosidase, partial [Verrucomicrobiales bacterium]
MRTTAIAACLMAWLLPWGSQRAAAAPVSGPLQIRDGYFWNPETGKHFFPRGVAYQTWNPPVFANQSFEQVEYDMRQFAKLRLNSVRAEFVWGEVEVEEDSYDWTRPDFLIRTAEELGLKLFVLIGYQYPPSWFPEEHHAINDVGTRSDVMNYQSPVAQAAYAEHIAAVVSRYKDSPAIGAWILGNEFAYFDVWESQDLYPARRLLGYDPLSLTDFQNWLSNTYDSDIAALNANWSPTSPYTSFGEVVMPPVYPADRFDRGYHDLIQWRKQSIGKIIAMGAKAARDNDPNHLITYSMVGGILTGVDANNTCEDPEVIVQHCADAGAPIDFWSVNNYAWATEGSELRTADFGIAKYQYRIGLPVMLSETGHTSTENFNHDASGRQADVLPTTLWEAVSSGIVGMHFFHWNDRLNFTEDYFIRERGFGIVNQDRTSKGAVYDNIESMFRRLEEIDVAKLLAGSTDPDPDIVLYVSEESDMEFPRANQEQTMLSGILRRMGYQVGLIGSEAVMGGDFGAAKALDLPRCKRLEWDVLDHILNNVIPSGIHVHAHVDIPGQMNAYSHENPNWVTQVDNLFGIDVTTASVAWAGGVSQAPGETYKILTLNGASAFGSLPVNFNESFLTWKIWHGVQATTATTILTHSGLNGASETPALLFKDHGTAKTAIQTYAIADTHAGAPGSNSHPWDIRTDVVGAVYRDYFGVVPKIQLSGARARYV